MYMTSRFKMFQNVDRPDKTAVIFCLWKAGGIISIFTQNDPSLFWFLSFLSFFFFSLRGLLRGGSSFGVSLILASKTKANAFSERIDSLAKSSSWCETPTLTWSRAEGFQSITYSMLLQTYWCRWIAFPESDIKSIQCISTLRPVMLALCLSVFGPSGLPYTLCMGLFGFSFSKFNIVSGHRAIMLTLSDGLHPFLADPVPLCPYNFGVSDFVDKNRLQYSQPSKTCPTW